MDSAPDSIAEIDRHFARFLLRFGGDALAERAIHLLSRAVREHHVCLDLNVAPAVSRK